MDEAVERLISQMKPVKAAPTLRTVNGIGCRLSGRLLIPDVDTAYISILWLVVFFIPIIPIRIFVVSSAGRTYRLHGSLKLRNVLDAYGTRFFWILASSYIEGILLVILLLMVIVVVSSIMGVFR